MNPHQTSSPKRVYGILPRLLLGTAATIAALAIVEIALRAFDYPRTLKPHSDPPRFAFTTLGTPGNLCYVNQPGRITFRYDGNPRGYFDERNEVHHDVNPAGFRGPAVGVKPAGEKRIVFLGDSFTFGEGVRNEDVYPEVTARLLRQRSCQLDVVNLGVGGYNTTQSLQALNLFGLDLNPDVVVLGCTINDAEPPLFQIDPASGQPVRRPRERNIESEAAPQSPPGSGVYQLKLPQAVWQFQHSRELTRQTIAYYLAVNDPASDGWKESERALREIIERCNGRGIPCIVVMFPLLFDLTASHPFTPVYQRIGRVVTESGGHFIDLLPALTGMNPRALIVHPTDQHPNEVVHAIAGERIAAEVARLPGFKGTP